MIFLYSSYHNEHFNLKLSFGNIKDKRVDSFIFLYKMKKKFLTVLLGVLASVSAQTFAAQSGDSFTTSLFDKKNSLLETLS